MCHKRHTQPVQFKFADCQFHDRPENAIVLSKQDINSHMFCMQTWPRRLHTNASWQRSVAPRQLTISVSSSSGSTRGDSAGPQHANKFQSHAHCSMNATSASTHQDRAPHRHCNRMGLGLIISYDLISAPECCDIDTVGWIYHIHRCNIINQTCTKHEHHPKGVCALGCLYIHVHVPVCQIF